MNTKELKEFFRYYKNNRAGLSRVSIFPSIYDREHMTLPLRVDRRDSYLSLRHIESNEGGEPMILCCYDFSEYKDCAYWGKIVDKYNESVKEDDRGWIADDAKSVHFSTIGSALHFSDYVRDRGLRYKNPQNLILWSERMQGARMLLLALLDNGLVFEYPDIRSKEERKKYTEAEVSLILENLDNMDRYLAREQIVFYDHKFNKGRLLSVKAKFEKYIEKRNTEEYETKEKEENNKRIT